MDKAKIEQQAKQIMDNFLVSLQKVEHMPDEVGWEREHDVRKEKPAEKEEGFRERMLKNASRTKDGWIQAEKKKW